MVEFLAVQVILQGEGPCWHLSSHTMQQGGESRLDPRGSTVTEKMGDGRETQLLECGGLR